MKNKISITILSILLGLACNQTPISVSSFINNNTITPNTKTVKMEYRLRKGSYCGMILLGQSNTKADESLFAQKINIKYKITIPSLEYHMEKDLGQFDSKDYGYLTESGQFFYKFSINVKDISTPRVTVYIEAFFESKLDLELAEYGVNFSEWPCK